MPNSKTIVFIHGLFMNGSCWKPWEEYFTNKGYSCHSPSYPYHEGNAAARRKNIDPRLGKLRFKDVIDFLSNYIDQLPEKPILIGHSMGGSAAQKLLYLEKGVAAITISSAPPMGIFGLKWSFVRSNISIINPFKGNSVCLPTVHWYHFAICQKESIETVQQIYNEYVVPESRNVPRSGIGKDGYIDFKKEHPPLLFISGTDDYIIPISLNRKNYKAYSHKNSICEMKEFKGRTHFICWEKGWEEVIDYACKWMKQNTSLPENK